MRLATIRAAAGHRAVRVDEDAAVETGDADLRALLLPVGVGECRNTCRLEESR